MWRDEHLIDFLDHLADAGKQGRIKLTYEDGRTEFVKTELADDAKQAGTPINRENMMALQGFSNCDIYEDVNELGEKQVIEDYVDRNEKLITTFKLDGRIEEKFIGEKTITKTTTFNSNGSISEVIS